MTTANTFSAMLSVLGHDLANELAAASLTTAALRGDAAAGHVADTAALADLELVLATMRRKVEIALQLRRLIAGTVRSNRDRLRAASLAAEAAAAASVACDGEHDGHVDADHRLLLQALAGIIERAKSISRSHEAVRVQCDTADGRVRFRVDDAGPAAEVPRIESLLRSGECTIDHGVASIELAFARKVAELLGGHIEVAPSDAGGASITISLPVVSGAPAAG